MTEYEAERLRFTLMAVPRLIPTTHNLTPENPTFVGYDFITLDTFQWFSEVDETGYVG